LNAFFNQDPKIVIYAGEIIHTVVETKMQVALGSVRQDIK
jgi:hypothetical protein